MKIQEESMFCVRSDINQNLCDTLMENLFIYLLKDRHHDFLIINREKIEKKRSFNRFDLFRSMHIDR